MTANSSTTASPSPSPSLDLTRRSTFLHWVHLPIRYNDLDTLGHVNNTATSIYLEQARCDLLYPLIGEHRKAEIDIVIARLTIDFRRELTYPGIVDVGTSATKIGNSSFHLVHGLFKSGSDDCVTTAETICVWFSLSRRTSMTPPEDLKSGVAGILMRPSGS